MQEPRTSLPPPACAKSWSLVERWDFYACSYLSPLCLSQLISSFLFISFCLLPNSWQKSLLQCCCEPVIRKVTQIKSTGSLMPVQVCQVSGWLVRWHVAPLFLQQQGYKSVSIRDRKSVFYFSHFFLSLFVYFFFCETGSSGTARSLQPSQQAFSFVIRKKLVPSHRPSKHFSLQELYIIIQKGKKGTITMKAFHDTLHSKYFQCFPSSPSPPPNFFSNSDCCQGNKQAKISILKARTCLMYCLVVCTDRFLFIPLALWVHLFHQN